MELPKLSDKTRAICAKHWSDVGGMPTPTCCRGCPLSRPCGSPYATTYEGIAARRVAMNKQADNISLEL